MEVARCKQSANDVDGGLLSRKTRHGGGVAVIHSDKLCAKTIKFSIKPTTFEILGSNFSFCQRNFVVVTIYRPGSESVSDSFYTDLTSILETLAVFNCPLVIAVHVDNPNDTHARRLLELLDSFGLVQSAVLKPNSCYPTIYTSIPLLIALKHHQK